VDHQIYTSFFDNDWYKFLEDFYKYYFHPEASIRNTQINRTTSVRIADIVPLRAVQEQFEAARQVRFTEAQIAFLHGTGAFSKDILGYSERLRHFQLPEIEVRLGSEGQLFIESDSPDAVLWEIAALPIVNEMLNYYRMEKLGLNVTDVWREGERVLLEKIPVLRQLPKGSVLEFATRRRFSGPWQRFVWGILQNEVPEFVSATSNVDMAIETGTPWAGTHPHASIMLEQGIAFECGDDAVRESENQFFENWWSIFPYPNMVALPDTGGRGFWKRLRQELAIQARGFRWDSGPWEQFNADLVAASARWGVDPKTTFDAFYSDGLTPQEMVRIQTMSEHLFRNCFYGWGTNATNDMGRYKELGLTPISLVMKPTAINGIPVVKLSNNPEKATGDRATIERIKRIFGYNTADYEAVVPVY
jgi:nicotinate phosphoribosyltransferase